MIVERGSDEYWEVLSQKHVSKEACEKLPVELFIVRIVPLRYEFLCSKFNEDGYDAKQSSIQNLQSSAGRTGLHLPKRRLTMRLLRAVRWRRRLRRQRKPLRRTRKVSASQKFRKSGSPMIPAILRLFFARQRNHRMRTRISCQTCRQN